MTDERLVVAVAAMRQALDIIGAHNVAPSMAEEARQVANELVNKLAQKCNTCDVSYSCPTRRKSQWVWKDTPIVSTGCVCVECNEEIASGVSCISVTCHYEGKVMQGTRCNFCHKVSLDYCSQLGHLRETVRNKTGMDYVSGEFDDE
jgi:hypothetical protein